MLQAVDTINSDTVSFVLAIRRISESQNHSAIAFKGEDEEFRLLHLGWNYTLYYEPLKQSYFWVDNSLDPVNAKYLAVVCDRIARRQPGIPYGLNAEGFSFDPQTGNIIPGPTGRGFTCATFILAILKAVGLELLVETSWPEEANVEWQRHIVDALRDEPDAPSEQKEAVARDIGSRRFTPEEVVGSSALSEWPISFEEAQHFGAIVNQDLDRLSAAA
ncbi:hypothetical protein [Sphingomonas sp. ABOLG]|uniref:hypothetical protein n=1 Tax=Sphingomonas sp. ABOLG TaxID=1985880 RepID=UPI0013DE141E|nr:hypothetical protein [Sphingomonas sp. ABOLG]